MMSLYLSSSFLFVMTYHDSFSIWSSCIFFICYVPERTQICCIEYRNSGNDLTEGIYTQKAVKHYFSSGSCVLLTGFVKMVTQTSLRARLLTVPEAIGNVIDARREEQRREALTNATNDSLDRQRLESVGNGCGGSIPVTTDEVCNQSSDVRGSHGSTGDIVGSL